MKSRSERSLPDNFREMAEAGLLNMNLILLTHEREAHKLSNTGRLVESVLPGSRIIMWQRKQPDVELLRLIEQGGVALVYPGEGSIELALSEPYDNYILIDSTWQQARKIFNHSPYLHGLPRISINPAEMSQYTLRRNQIEGGLCTAECAIELMRTRGLESEAIELEQRLVEFISIKGVARELAREHR